MNSNGYIEMVFKSTGERVRVYAIHNDGPNRSVATVFVPSFAAKSKNAGNAWQTVQMSRLIPVDCWDGEAFISKNEKNKIKSRLKLISAEWECTDGTIYKHENLEEAIEYERALMKGEVKEIEE